MELKATKIGFIGAGNMASALIRGLIKAQVPPGQLWATDVNQPKLKALAKELSIHAVDSSDELIASCDVVLVATKPKTVLEVLRDRPAEGRLWISIAAGVKLSQIEDAFSGEARVIRAMPNTPALVGQGATGLCGGSGLHDGDLKFAQSLLKVVGQCVIVDETMMDALTGLSGSGPAYVMLMIEALADGGVRAGLPRDVAMNLAMQTLRGAATLAQESGLHPGQLKDMVTSPGGTTITGVQVLEQRGLRGALMDAVVAAAERSRQLEKK